MKPYRIKRTSRNMGLFCSIRCSSEYRKIWYRGSNNPQYGLKGILNASFKGEEIPNQNNNVVDIFVYAPNRLDADSHGRVPKHRLLVEQNWQLYKVDAFDVIDGQHILRKGYDVHHIDGNHGNNELQNLAVLTRREHMKIHSSQRRIIRNPNNGWIIGSAPIEKSNTGK